MTRDEILRLARDAGFEREMRHEGSGVIVLPDALFIRFAALVEEHLTFSSIHTCSPGCTKPACVARQMAVAEEREACAQMCESQWSNEAERIYGEEIAAVIRSRA